MFDKDIYETRGLAVTAKKEKQEVDELLASLNMDDESQIQDAYSVLSNRNFIYKKSKKYIDKLKNRLTEIDTQARTVDDDIYETRELAATAEKERQEIENLIALVDMENEQSVGFLLERMAQMCFSYKKASLIISNLQIKFNDFEIKKRTVKNTIYNTIEEAEFAKTCFFLI